MSLQDGKNRGCHAHPGAPGRGHAQCRGQERRLNKEMADLAVVDAELAGGTLEVTLEIINKTGPWKGCRSRKH